MSAARSRVVQPAPAFEHAASGQSGTSAIRGSRSRSRPSVRAAPRPSPGREVEQAARRCHPEARLGLAAQVVGEGDEPRRATEDLGLRLGEPRELRRPEGGMEERAGARVNRLGVEPLREPLGGSALRVSRQPRIGVSAFPSSSTATRLCAKHEIASGSSSPSTRRTAAATSAGSSDSYSSCRRSPAARRARRSAGRAPRRSRRRARQHAHGVPEQQRGALAGKYDAGNLWSEQERVEHELARLPKRCFRHGLVDSLREPLRLDSERRDELRQPLPARLPDAVEREHDAEHVLEIVREHRSERQPATGPEVGADTEGMLEPLLGRRMDD